MSTDKLYYGVAYYDEYMPYDRVEKDMEMIAKAGMNVVRIAESTWSTWEPREGEFDFTHLHRMLDAAEKYRLSVIVGTPTYAIPSWLANKADDMLTLTHKGQSIYGARQNMDITNPIYLKHAKIIIEKLMEEVKDQPHVIGFQLDNETKSYDTCSKRAQAMFVEELKKQWPDLEEFNKEFGLDYWSNKIGAWEDFPDVRGTINMSLATEYKKFQRKLVTDFLMWQSEIISKYKRPDQFVTHNFDFDWHGYSYGVQPDVDHFAASDAVTIGGCDIYHPTQDDLTGKEITACGNIARGLKKDNYLVLETEAQGHPGWLAYPNQLRLQAYSHIANGANMVEYWHWHSIHNSMETYWKGVLSHDLAENETYRDCVKIGHELRRIEGKIKNLKKTNKVAIMISNESLSGLAAYYIGGFNPSFYNDVYRWLADALFTMNIEFDVIPSRADAIAGYDYIFVPAMYSATEELLTALNDYVRNGGNLIATFKTGFTDEHLKVYCDMQPHILHEALGIHYDQFTTPKDVTVSFNGVDGAAKEWMEMVYCDSAKPLANYSHHTWNNYVAVAENDFGKGHSLYLATIFDEKVLMEILRSFFEKTGYSETQKIAVNAQYPLAVKQGVNDEGNNIVYLLNYSRFDQSFNNGELAAEELLTKSMIAAKDTLTVEPWGVAILEYK